MSGIPVIHPYRLPSETELPQNTATWTASPTRAVLLLHDLQRYFLAPFPPTDEPLATLLRNVTMLRERCRSLGVPVAYTQQPGGMTAEQRGLLADFWGPGMRGDPSHRAVVDPVAPADGDWLFTKWRYSAFCRTDLFDRIRAAGRDQLLVCGVYAHVGILSTLIDAFSNDIQSFLVADAVGDFTEAEHRMAVEYAARRCAMVTTTERTLAALGTGGELPEVSA